MYGFLSYTGLTRRNTFIHMRVAASQEYVNTYSTRKVHLCTQTHGLRVRVHPALDELPSVLHSPSLQIHGKNEHRPFEWACRAVGLCSTFVLQGGRRVNPNPVLTGDDAMLTTPKRHLPTPGQCGHSPQRHTAAGTAAPTTTDTGNTVRLTLTLSPACNYTG